jgi:hypothetical protein
MSLANVLAGIGGAYQAVQKGMDDAQARKDADEQRKWREEEKAALRDDRAFRTEQRGIWRTEQQRKDEEWGRSERLRKADADAYGRLGTEESEAPAPTATPSSVATPSPAAAPKAQNTSTFSPIPTADKVTLPDPSLGDRGVARVESATMSPGYKPASDSPPAEPTAKAADSPVEPPAAPANNMPKRRITYGDVLRQMAKSRSKEGMTAEAIKFNDEATKWDLDQANRRLTTLIGGADTMSLEDYAGSAAKLFNSDPLPQSITGVKVNPDKTVTVTIKHNDNGAETTRTFKDKNELTSTLQSFYQPEAFNKLRQANAEAALKTEKLGAGDILVQGGKKVAENTNESPTVTAARVRAEGSGGTGTGKASTKTQDPYKDVADAFELAATKGASPLLSGQIATGRRIAMDMAKNGVDQGLAVEAALEIAVNPKAAKLDINYATGEIDQVYQNPNVNRGQAIKVSPGVGKVADLEKQMGGKEAMKPVVDGLLNHMTSAVPAEQRSAAVAQLQDIAVSPEKTKAYLEAARGAGKNVAVISRQLEILRAYPAAKEAPAPMRSLLPNVGGIKRDYTPPPGSESAKWADRQKAARADQDAKDAARQERAANLSKTIADVLASDDPARAQAVQDDPDFELLPREQKIAIFRMVNGR